MFDLVNGLPLHPLVVHAVVVLLPSLAVVTFAVALRPAWRRHARVVAAADAVVLVLAWVATQSGERLQGRLEGLSGGPVAREHAEQGDLVPWCALGVLVAALLVTAAHRRPRLAPVAVVAAGLAGAVAIAWTVFTGESGASAVWRDVVESTR